MPAKRAIPKQLRDLVWNTHIGHEVATAPCSCCERNPISMQEFHCGHVVAEARGGTTTVENLRPICAPCNLSMGTMNMLEYQRTFGLAGMPPVPAPPPPPEPTVWSRLTVPGLTNACDFYGLSTAGLREELARRLDAVDPIPFLRFNLTGSLQHGVLVIIARGMGIPVPEGVNKDQLAARIVAGPLWTFVVCSADGLLILKNVEKPARAPRTPKAPAAVAPPQVSRPIPPAAAVAAAMGAVTISPPAAPPFVPPRSYFGLFRSSPMPPPSSPIPPRPSLTSAPMEPLTWSILSVDALKAAALHYGLKRSGVKAELVARLEAHSPIDVYLARLPPEEVVALRARAKTSA